MDEVFTDKAKQVLLIAQEEAQSFKHQSVGTEHLLSALINEQGGIAGKILRQSGLSKDYVRAEIETIIGYGNHKAGTTPMYLPYSPRAKKVLAYASDESKRLGAPCIGTEHILLGLLREEEILAVRILKNFGLDIAKTRQYTLKKIGVSESKTSKIGQKKGGTQRQAQMPQEGTPTLDMLARDLTRLAYDSKMDPVVGRSKEIERLIQILSRRTKNNPILVGEPGVGKTAIAEGLAQKIVSGEVPDDMVGKRLMMLDMGSLVAGTKYRGEFEDRMKKIIEEIYHDGQVILFIDELHTLIGAGGAEGAIDASNILKPALARGEIQTVGATTLDEYQKYIEKDAALERRFAKILVEEPSEEEAVEILIGLREYYERHHQVAISEEAVEAAVHLSTRYMTERQLPDKAIDLIDEASAKVRLAKANKVSKRTKMRQKYEEILREKEVALHEQDFELAADLRRKEKLQVKKIEKYEEELAIRESSYELEVSAEDIAEIVSQTTNIPLRQLEKKESERLINLEDELHKRVIGQKEAVSAVARATRRARSGLKDPKRPIGSFMFLGPTGVGKTELAKALAESVFGSEEALVRVDMSEFMEKHATSRLIGSPPGYVGYDEGGQLTEKIRQKPYSVILLDEVEKAHPDIFNILLQVLDDGYLTDTKGRKVDFRNTIIILTSNIGATALKEEKSVGFNAKNIQTDHKAMSSKILEELKKAFKPEFLNRIDETIVFHSLDQKELREIVKILSKSLVSRLQVQNISLKFTVAALDIIAQEGFDPEYGARPIKRALQKEVEDRLSEALLLGQISRGDTVTIGSSKGKINVTVSEKTLENTVEKG
ncbi:ATP-dependent Clp protease ATP-binding subunit [Vagococcus intermedius]|uniref:ATP-dependent Clp protease ATP-binding subunit n=1 Tax=Vagococcus intermedius TaxID=2991418 RepID=A0AAF0I8P3_9ENTE|nr:ATP-dependent Clp protease ATP-binding subunit [Vagococcus intermedius]WEG74354.1 ATP-dependent Clp protease ATP-binding subunit [Vagococcus intermedius]WEG76442.1 ATP-dependent Clp protease ATP-binding subunit [Vagococcus intermedius]